MEEGRKRSRDEIISEIACKKMEIAALEEEAETLKKDCALSAAKQIMPGITEINISKMNPTLVSVKFIASTMSFKLSSIPRLMLERESVYDVIEPAQFSLLYNSSAARETLAINMEMVQARTRDEYTQKMSLFLGKIYGALVQYFVTLENYDDLEKFRRLWYIALSK